MPELEIPDLHLPEAGLYLFGVMLSPRDHTKVLSFVKAAEDMAFLNVMAQIDAKELAPELAPDILERYLIANRANKFPHWARENSNNVFNRQLIRPQMAAQILVYVLSCAKHDPTNATLEHAYKFMRAAFDRARLKGASRAYLAQIWADYSPVAHLWAAKSIAPDLWGQLGMELATFLSLADHIRAMGEAHKAAKSEGPLLDPRETWTIPSRFILPAVAIDLPTPDRLREAAAEWGRHV